MYAVAAALCGLIAIAAVAFIHNYCLIRISESIPRERLDKRWLGLVIFTLLAVLHLAEIVAFAAYLQMLTLVWPGSVGSAPPMSFTDFVYFSGINFTTLGLSRVEMEGPLRIVTMMQSLAGFMLLTWSAGYLYAACGRYWRN